MQLGINIAVIIIWLVCVIVCFLKWKTWTAIFGIIAPVLSNIPIGGMYLHHIITEPFIYLGLPAAAIRLAKPVSWWAKWFYWGPMGSDRQLLRPSPKLARALARFPEQTVDFEKPGSVPPSTPSKTASSADTPTPSPVPQPVAQQTIRRIDIVFNCPRCGQRLSVEERGTGMLVNCPSCKEQIEIPRSTGSQSPEVPVRATVPPISPEPPRKRSVLAPPYTLTRKQYIIPWLIVFAVLVIAFLFFVSAPNDVAQFAGSVFVIVNLLAFFYNIFWLSLPRLRSAKLPDYWIVGLFVPFGVFVLFAILAIAEEKT